MAAWQKEQKDLSPFFSWNNYLINRIEDQIKYIRIQNKTEHFNKSPASFKHTIKSINFINYISF